MTNFKKGLTRIFGALLVYLLSTSIYAAEIEIVTVETSGSGKTRDAAVNEALSAAVAKVNGVSVASNTHSVTGHESMRTSGSSQTVTVAAARIDTQGPSGNQSATAQGVAVEATNIKSNLDVDYDASKKDINTKSSGQIKTYEVIDSKKTSDGYIVRISASIAKLKLSEETKRKRLAVVPFRVKITGSKARDFERLFTEVLVDQLTQSRKFAILDRDYIDEQGVELGRLQAGEVPVDEMAKLGNKLATDFLLVGTINDVVSRNRTIIMKSTGKEIAMADQGVRISYRLIEAATGQVKFSDSYDNVTTEQGSLSAIATMAKNAGNTVSKNILLNFFPVMVEAVQGNVLILGQGGKTLSRGQTFSLIQYGEEIFDSYTKESLGRSEKNIGTVEIVEISSKQSRARIVKSSIDIGSLFKPNNFILKPLPKKNNTNTKAKQAKKVKAEAKKRIKDLKKASDDDW